jgi:hypothetical protein
MEKKSLLQRDINYLMNIIFHNAPTTKDVIEILNGINESEYIIEQEGLIIKVKKKLGIYNNKIN